MKRLPFLLLWVLCGVSTAVGAQTVATHPDAQLQLPDLQADLLRVPDANRAAFLGNRDAIKSNASNLLLRRVLAAEAQRDGLDKDPVVQAAIALARDRVLSDARLARIDQANQPSLQDLEAFARTSYTAEAKRFEAPEQVRVRHILIKTETPDAKAKAEQLLDKLKAGGDFEALAKAESQDPGSAANGGDLGYFVKGRMVPGFEDAAFALKTPGELSGLVESPFGWHILRFEDRKAAGPRPFEEVKDQLLREAQGKILNNGRGEMRDRILKDLKVDDAAIDAFMAANPR